MMGIWANIVKTPIRAVYKRRHEILVNASKGNLLSHTLGHQGAGNGFGMNLSEWIVTELDFYFPRVPGNHRLQPGLIGPASRTLIISELHEGESSSRVPDTS